MNTAYQKNFEISFQFGEHSFWDLLKKNDQAFSWFGLYSEWPNHYLIILHYLIVREIETEKCSRSVSAKALIYQKRNVETGLSKERRADVYVP